MTWSHGAKNGTPTGRYPRPVVTLCVLLLLACCTGTPARTTPTPATGGTTGLQVRDNRLVDGAGRTVRLTGFNHSGAEYACVEGWGVFDAPADPAAVTAAMASWSGANAVRLPLNEQCWLGLGTDPRYSGDAYRAAIAKMVDELSAKGFAVILDLHRSAPGAARSLNQETMPDRDHSIDFWRSVASAFANRSNVVFDVFNEPAPYSGESSARAWKCWRDGGCVLRSTNGGGDFVAAGMTELVAAIRAAGARNVVLVGGIRWAEQLDDWLTYRPDDPAHNLAASFHDYSFNTVCASRDCYDTVLARLVAHVPLVVGEIGPDLTLSAQDADRNCPPSAVHGTRFVTEAFDWMDAHGVSYTAWSWNRWPSCWALISDWSGTPTPIWGEFVHDHLRGH
ncbi:MAG TPA: cellulase family glycosylhydrolase [Actinocatenispora sp.]